MIATFDNKIDYVSFFDSELMSQFLSSTYSSSSHSSSFSGLDSSPLGYHSISKIKGSNKILNSNLTVDLLPKNHCDKKVEFDGNF